jgi:hypothetical protein
LSKNFAAPAATINHRFSANAYKLLRQLPFACCKPLSATDWHLYHFLQRVASILHPLLKDFANFFFVAPAASPQPAFASSSSSLTTSGALCTYRQMNASTSSCFSKLFYKLFLATRRNTLVGLPLAN